MTKGKAVDNGSKVLTVAGSKWQTPQSWWWLSFADADLPKGQQFLGVAIVQAATLPDAITRAWELGINPGGQVMSAQLPIGPDRRIAPAWSDRLLDKAEAERASANDADEWLIVPVSS